MMFPVSASAVCTDGRTAIASIVKSKATIPTSSKFFLLNRCIILSSGHLIDQPPTRRSLLTPLQKKPTMRFDYKKIRMELLITFTGKIEQYALRKPVGDYKGFLDLPAVRTQQFLAAIAQHVRTLH
jgi:hypothetical protein